MDVSNYQFSDEEIARFHQYRDNQDDARLKARFIALLMLAEGIEINKVASIHKTFRAKAFQLLNHVDEHVDEFKSLMVEKFQIVKTKA